MHTLVGFVVGALSVGVVVVLILQSVKGLLGVARAGSVGGLGGPFVMPQPPPLLALQPSRLANAMQMNDGTSLATRTDTVLLSTTRSSIVFSAPNHGPTWKVRIGALGAAGSFVSLAIDTQPDPDGGRSIVIPAGGQAVITIGARQTISGIAIGADVPVSYVASAEVV